MESLSPLVRNTSVRRLSLELVQKFATNLLTSPTTITSINAKATSRSGRRASDAFESTLSSTPRRASTSTHTSPISPFAFNLSNLGSRSPVPPSSNPGGQIQPEETWPENKRPRKSSMVTCHVIPPSPVRRASLSLSPQKGLIPSTFQRFSSPNKENQLPVNANVSRRSSPCNSSGVDLFGADLVTAAARLFGLTLRPQEVLGRGSFGTVVAASYKGSDVAVKVLRQQKSENHVKGELNGLHLPPHPHIVSVLDVLRIPPDRSLILLERMQPGNLLSLINDSESFTADVALEFAVDISTQIASALTFCHSNGILHLDVKPQNILLHHPNQAKLSDFGNSRSILDLNRATNFNKLDGTVGYKAPELFRGDKPTSKCDVYSLSVTMWQLLTREQPYLGETEHSVIYKVVAQGLRPKAVCRFHPQNHDIRETQFILIYERAWNGDPTRRQSMSELHEQLTHLYQTQFRHLKSISSKRTSLSHSSTNKPSHKSSTINQNLLTHQ